MQICPGTGVAGESRQEKLASQMNYLHHVHPAITVFTLVLLALTLVGTLTAFGMLP